MKQLIVGLAVFLASATTLIAGMHMSDHGKQMMGDNTPMKSNDGRQLVQLPPMMRTHMLGNMRDHLLALSEIQQALSEGEFEKAGEIAESRLGMSSTQAHGAQRMGPMMPQGMRQMGMQMHRAASRFAVTVQESAVDDDAKRAIGSLSNVIQQCVACHAAYRVN